MIRKGFSVIVNVDKDNSSKHVITLKVNENAYGIALPPVSLAELKEIKRTLEAYIIK